MPGVKNLPIPIASVESGNKEFKWSKYWCFYCQINPILIGTANYWKSSVTKEIFQYVDNYIWKITYRFLKRLHPKKP
ncbi:group II intron maturase-specific domain-containing protein [Priestia megaterium]|uniref:group II intron maturase-specific domain-containing protein n=1 Tax=Priestia megaterium TaxID=1404 RepID=UPI0034DF629E